MKGIYSNSLDPRTLESINNILRILTTFEEGPLTNLNANQIEFLDELNRLVNSVMTFANGLGIEYDFYLDRGHPGWRLIYRAPKNE